MLCIIERSRKIATMSLNDTSVGTCTRLIAHFAPGLELIFVRQSAYWTWFPSVFVFRLLEMEAMLCTGLLPQIKVITG